MKCHFCGVTIMVGEPGVRTDNCCVYHENMLGCVLALRTSLTKAEGEVTAWKDRFRAIVGDDSPDGAGNRVITLQSDLRTLRGGKINVEGMAKVVYEYQSGLSWEPVHELSRVKWLELARAIVAHLEEK